MINKDEYLEYISRIQDNPESILEYVRNEQEIIDFEKNGTQIGFINNSPFYDIVLGLFRNKETGRVFRYPAFIYPKEGACIIVVLNSKNGKYILMEKHFREFHNKHVLEIPRGYALNSKVSAVITAMTELSEELSLSTTENNLKEIGEVYPDTGISNNIVKIFKIDIKGDFKPKNTDCDEQIDDFMFIPYKKIKEKIINREIVDAYSLTAFLLYDLNS